MEKPKNENRTVKIAKYLSQAGVASRRRAEELVRQGLVFINGKKITDPAVRVNPDVDKIICQGKPAQIATKAYYLLHKPLGYVCTTQDRHAEKLITDLVPANPKVWPAGRLDKMTSGLIILTNDGTLTLKLTHPRYRMEKEYEITANFPLSADEIKIAKKGLTLEDGFIKPDLFEAIGVKKYRIIIHSGKKRVVRRIIEKIGKNTVQLKRTRVGFLTLGKLPPGQWRNLDASEISRLLN